jgi:predicted transcriptional regulator
MILMDVTAGSHDYSDAIWLVVIWAKYGRFVVVLVGVVRCREIGIIKLSHVNNSMNKRRASNHSLQVSKRFYLQEGLT